MYVKYTLYKLLPSGRVWKLESYCKIDNLEKYLSKIFLEVIAIVLHTEPKVMFFNKSLFEYSLQFEDKEQAIPELIMEMKRIERNKGQVINL